MTINTGVRLSDVYWRTCCYRCGEEKFVRYKGKAFIEMAGLSPSDFEDLDGWNVESVLPQTTEHGINFAKVVLCDECRAKLFDEMLEFFDIG